MIRIKNNKPLSFIGVFLITLMMTGCSYLDVTPRERSESEDLFSTEDGFKYALTGIYLMLAESDLYGRNTSYYMPEWLVQHWVISSSQTSNNYIFSNYDFSDNKGDGLIGTVWKGYYHAIAQINDMLAALEESKPELSSETISRVLEGELYGLRGFLHMEVLRFWGPVPSLAASGTKSIPYMTEATLETERLLSLSWKEVVDGIISDLNKSEELLAEIDPILLSSPSYTDGWSSSTYENWLMYRKNRFNYMAAIAAKARFYSWIEPSGLYPDAAAQAIKYAQQTLDATWRNEVSGEQTKLFNLVNGQSLSTEGYTLYGEAIFSLHVNQLQSYIKTPFTNEHPECHQTESNLQTAYELASGIGTGDMRYTAYKLWEKKTTNNKLTYMYFQKYGGNTSFNNGLQAQARNQVPLIRLSEMYLILMEYLPFGQAFTLFKEYRVAKSMNVMVESTFTEDGRLSRLESEYRKDFFGEGQMFFFYKKHAYTTLTWPGFTLPRGLSDYVLPKPRAQQDFEN